MISHLKQTLFDFIQFLKKPKDEKLANQTKTQSLICFIVLLLFCYLMSSITGLIIYFFENLGFYSTKDHAIIKRVDNMPFFAVLVFGVLIAPISEELIFRLPLRYKYNVIVRFMLLFSKFSSKRKQVNVRLFLKKNWNKYYGLHFYFITALFAIIHIFNYKYSVNILIFSPLLVLPQFIIGLVLGYIRVWYNFFLGILFHATYNGILFISVFYALNMPVERRSETTSDYKIVIEDVKKNSSNDAKSTIGTDKINFENYSLNAVIAELLDKNIDLIETNNLDSFAKKINIKFEQVNQSKSVNANKLLSLLSETYHFKIVKNFKFQDVYELHMFDTVLFNNHKLKYANQIMEISNNNNEVKLTNATFTSMVKTLSSIYKLNISNNIDSIAQFNFNLPVNDFSKVSYILKFEYGIKITKKTKSVEFIKIEFPVTSEK